MTVKISLPQMFDIFVAVLVSKMAVLTISKRH